MSPRRKTSQSKRKKKTTKRREQFRLSSHDKNPERHLTRRQDLKSTVSDLVYKCLRNAAYQESVQKQRNNACIRFRRKNARKRSLQSLRTVIAGNEQVRSYMREALSFGVDAGYFVPTDRTGKVLLLSPCLSLPQSYNKKGKRMKRLRNHKK